MQRVCQRSSSRRLDVGATKAAAADMSALLFALLSFFVRSHSEASAACSAAKCVWKFCTLRGAALGVRPCPADAAVRNLVVVWACGLVNQWPLQIVEGPSCKIFAGAVVYQHSSGCNNWIYIPVLFLADQVSGFLCHRKGADIDHMCLALTKHCLQHRT